ILERNDTTARRVPALVGILLVLQLDARSARRFVTTDGEIDVQQATIPRVAVSDDPRLRPLSELTYAPNHIRIGCKPRIRQTEVRGHRSEARHVQNVKPHAIGDLCRDHIEYARSRDETGLLESRGERLAHGHLS